MIAPVDYLSLPALSLQKHLYAAVSHSVLLVKEQKRPADSLPLLGAGLVAPLPLLASCDVAHSSFQMLIVAVTINLSNSDQGEICKTALQVRAL